MEVPLRIVQQDGSTTMPNTESSPAAPPDLQALLRDGKGHWSLDPAASSVEFHVKHFWGVMTVRGRFEQLAGEGTVEADGSVSGRLQIAAASVNTKNRKRDEHLRSADFFDAEQHPTIVVTAQRLIPAGSGALRGQISLEVAGRQQALEPTVEVVDATTDAVTFRAETTVDRSVFGMTWSPLGMASPQARAVATARFIRR
jgi:polyisoprenoid-binding protein YceI